MIRPIPQAIYVVVLGLWFLTCEAQADPGTPVEQYAALMREYRPASSGMRDAKTDRKRKMAVERMGAFGPRFVELAEKYPKDAIALKALRQAIQVVGSTDSGAQIAWETNRSDFPAGSPHDAAGRIVDLVLRHHLKSDQLGPVIDRMRYGYRLEFEKCLSTVIEKNPHRHIRGVACLALARFLNDRLRMRQLADDRPDLAKRYEVVFGKDYLRLLRRLGRDKLAQRIESLFERAVEEYGDVKFRIGVTVGEQAKSELYDLRHLAVGKVAPDIKGKDQDGKPFKLSDYRGKVVLLYFWMEL